MINHDVIIVGGGPAGTSCATLLSRAGLEVLLLDKARFPREKICGDCINPACWEFFELLGVADELRKNELRTIRNVRIAHPDGRALTLNVPEQPERPFFAIKRSELDDALLRHASGAGASIIEGRRVVDAQWNGRWCVLARTDEGGIQEFHATHFLVGADGRNSVVARALRNSSFSRNGGRSKRNGERVAIQWYAPFQVEAESAVEMFLFDSGYCGVVNVDSRCANVAMVTLPSVLQGGHRDFERLMEATFDQNEIARQRVTQLAPLNGLTSAFPINPAEHRSHHPNAFLIGDARRTVEPFTGEGVLFALQDGVRAASNILRQMGAASPDYQVSTRSSFSVNHLFSPALRRTPLSHALVGLAARFPALIPIASRLVLR